MSPRFALLVSAIFATVTAGQCDPPRPRTPNTVNAITCPEGQVQWCDDSDPPNCECRDPGAA